MSQYFIRVVNFYPSGDCYDTDAKNKYSEIDSDYYNFAKQYKNKVIELIKLDINLNQIIKAHYPVSK